MKLIITIDTEEDNWANYSATINPVENIEELVPLQRLFDDYGVKPTYLITYPVATNPKSVEILRRIIEEEKCEIGMHCHPWNTPPFNGKADISARDTMLCNLPINMVEQKLSVLHATINNNFGVEPVSFRAGRWGFGSNAARAIKKLGYKVDSSVTPYTTWAEYYGVDYRHMSPRPYRFSPGNIFKAVDRGELLQMPATIGFLQRNYEICNRILNFVDASKYNVFRLSAILAKLKLVNKVALSPEIATGDAMVSLAERMKALGYEYLNLFFHSTSLRSGMSPFNRNHSESKMLIKNLSIFLKYAKFTDMESITLKDANLLCLNGL